MLNKKKIIKHRDIEKLIFYGLVVGDGVITVYTCGRIYLLGCI